MSYAYWAGLASPAGNHLFVLHEEVITGRAQEILPTLDTPDLDLATAMAHAEALQLARDEVGWPSDWRDQDAYGQSLLSAPAHPDTVAAAAGVHWIDSMPSLPGT